jgi:hypothetical protein
MGILASCTPLVTMTVGAAKLTALGPRRRGHLRARHGWTCPRFLRPRLTQWGAGGRTHPQTEMGQGDTPKTPIVTRGDLARGDLARPRRRKTTPNLPGGNCKALWHSRRSPSRRQSWCRFSERRYDFAIQPRSRLLSAEREGGRNPLRAHAHRGVGWPGCGTLSVTTKCYGTLCT